MSKKNEAPSADPKKAGEIGPLARKLLVETDQTYAEIVQAIRVKFPKAQTSARSVASIACNLRKKGVDVPMRRTQKKEG